MRENKFYIHFSIEFEFNYTHTENACNHQLNKLQMKNNKIFYTPTIYPSGEVHMT